MTSVTHHSPSNVLSLDSLEPETPSVDLLSHPNGAEPEESSEAPPHLRALEARVTVLETAILEHATILRDRIGQRLDRLEDKLRYESNGLRRAMETENADRDEKIVQLTQSLTAAVDRVETNHSTGSVKATMEDLIAALSATRSHLDTLAQAVSQTRVELSS